MDNDLFIKYDSMEEMLRNIHYKVCRADFRVESPAKKREIVDDFNGDNNHLCQSIAALIALNDDNALIPHGIGGHARGLLSAAYHRLRQDVGKRELVEYIEACDQVDEKPISDENMAKRIAYIWLSPAQVFRLCLSCLWWKYCARKTTRQ